ncbi:biotin carboxyl carrier protein [Rhizobium skierniewicense]|uniref:Biotin carboxyl carrier protein of acetyl-CoA carboxylase n=1 Tax=Rhizobium skierniewicense TaxID=984260 RepID=A0A7W6G1G1_9HYPH|nr:acetyl-CoA carboxylase [Rhizobium skierniewicense]MBB3944481.1 biotin carboxyl carrier protein [Rhizobium skierniewicense]
MTHILSPLPGTFYRSAAPGQPPLKADGEDVAVGDVIGLIEVMKSFHEVRSDVAGSGINFLVDNEEPVMAGAALADLS